jgi:hypothetical protein
MPRGGAPRRRSGSAFSAAQRAIVHESYIPVALCRRISNGFESNHRKISNGLPIAHVSSSFQNDSHNIIGNCQGAHWIAAEEKER